MKLAERKAKFKKENIRFYRLLAGLSQTDLARSGDFDHRTVCYWESDKFPNRIPSQKNEAILARRLGCHVDDFYRDVDEGVVSDYRPYAFERLIRRYFQFIESDDLSEVREARHIFALLYPDPIRHDINLTVNDTEDSDADLLDEGDEPACEVN